MHQHQLGPVGRKRLKAGADRGLPGGAAEDRRQDLEPCSRILETPHVVWMDDGLNHRNPGMAGERLPYHGEVRRCDDDRTHEVPAGTFGLIDKSMHGYPIRTGEATGMPGYP